LNQKKQFFMNDYIWESGVRPMLWGLLAMAGYCFWLWFFYARFEPWLRPLLGWALVVQLHFNHRGYWATGGLNVLHRFFAVMLADILFFVQIIGPFFALIILWWWMNH
jgi:hypothetical protein